MEQEPSFGFEKDLSQPEKAGDKDASSKTEKKKERAALLTKRTFERERQREEEPRARQAGEKLLTVVGTEKSDETNKEEASEATATPEGLDHTVTPETEVDSQGAEPEAVSSPEDTVEAESDAEPESDEEAEPNDHDDDGDVQPVVPPTARKASKLKPPTMSSPPPGNQGPPSPPHTPPPPPGNQPPGGNLPPQNHNHNLPPNHPQNPNNPNFNQAPAATPNVQPPAPGNVITDDDLLAAEKRGLRKGVVTGGVAAWALTRHSQTKKREAAVKELKSEIDAQDKQIEALQAEVSKDAAPLAAEQKVVDTQTEAEAAKPIGGNIVSLNAEKADAPTKLFVDPTPPTTERPVVVTARSETVVGAKEATLVTKPEVQSQPTETAPASMQDIEQRANVQASEKAPEQSQVISPELDKQYREDAAEKLDRPQDAGGLSGGGAAVGPAVATPVHTPAPTIGPAEAHDPVAKSVTHARKQAKQAADRAKLRSRLELAFALGLVLFMILIYIAVKVL